MLMLQRPEITQEELGKNRTQFVIEPLEPGFGLTLGNTMRRALLSRVPGVAHNRNNSGRNTCFYRKLILILCL